MDSDYQTVLFPKQFQVYLQRLIWRQISRFSSINSHSSQFIRMEERRGGLFLKTCLDKFGQLFHFHQFHVIHGNTDIADNALFDFVSDAFTGDNLYGLPW